MACGGPEEPPCAPPLSATGPSPRALRLAGSGPLGLTFKFLFRAPGRGRDSRGSATRGPCQPPTGFAGAIAMMMPNMPAPQCPAGQCWLATRRRVRVASEMARDLRLAVSMRERQTAILRRLRYLRGGESDHWRWWPLATCLNLKLPQWFVSVPVPAPVPATALGDDAPRSSDD